MVSAYLEGLRRAAGRPLTLLGVWLAGVLVALPAATVMGSALDRSFGKSLDADAMRLGFDTRWYGEFRAESEEQLASTLDPGQVGVGAFLDNLEDWVTGGLFDSLPQLLALGLAHVLVWSLLLGGVLTRYAPADRDAPRPGFLEAGGRYFFRFVRLALIGTPFYYGIYRLYRGSQEWLGDFTRDTTRESTVLLYSVVIVLCSAGLLVIVRTCLDYAKVATVLEERRSMLLAALRGLGFVLANPGRALGLYAMVGLTSLVLLLLYAVAAPGAGQSTTVTVWVAFAVGQAFLLARLYLRLSLLAGEMALYRRLTVGADPVPTSLPLTPATAGSPAAPEPAPPV